MKISDNFYARLFRTGISLAAVFIIGICGYILIEDMSFTDAFYMTVITVSTTGLYVGNTLTEPGKYFTALLVILGIATFVQGINIITTFVMNDYYNAMFKKRRLLKMISKFNKHIIICGCGELGLEIIKEIKKKGEECVVVDNNSAVKQSFVSEDMQIPFIEGDSANDETLINAGIKKARCLITTIEDDAQNVFTVLTARGLNANIQIISNCIHPSTKPKLSKAGADKIILPNYTGAKRMAAIALRPEISDFIDNLIYDDKSEIRIETIKISVDSVLSNKTLGELKLPMRTGIIVVAIKDNATGQLYFNPSFNSVIKPGDLLIILGPGKKISLLDKLIEINDLNEFDIKKNAIEEVSSEV